MFETAEGDECVVRLPAELFDWCASVERCERLQCHLKVNELAVDIGERLRSSLMEPREPREVLIPDTPEPGRKPRAERATAERPKYGEDDLDAFHHPSMHESAGRESPRYVTCRILRTKSRRTPRALRKLVALEIRRDAASHAIVKSKPNSKSLSSSPSE